MRSIASYLCIFIILMIIFPLKGTAQKVDTIIHINGNIMTGDFKKMAYGVATWKMDGMGTISFEEVKINTIRSKKNFEIKLKNGYIYFGSFDTSGIARKVNIVLPDRNYLIGIDEIVEVYPLKRSFWARTSGNFSLGANYSKGSNVASISFAGNIDYRKRKSFLELSLDDNNTFQGDSLSSSNSDLSFIWQRKLKKSWSSELGVSMSQNTELGNKLRAGFSAIGLKDITYNSWNRLYTGAGLNIARETPFGDEPSTTELAGIVQVVWKVYKYTIPKVWVDANITMFPYLTSNRRVRTVFNLNPKVSILSDNFKIGFKFYHNFDSKPSAEAASKTDYGINLELTYSFH